MITLSKKNQKGKLVLIVILFAFQTIAFGFVPEADSLKNSHKDQTGSDQTIQRLATTTADTKAETHTDCCKAYINKELDFGDWVLVALPIVFFTALLFLVLSTINSDTANKFSLKDALSESGYSRITKPNPKYNSENIKHLLDLQALNTAVPLAASALFPTSVDETDTKYRSSISRLIALITSILSLVIGLCLTSFFMYSYLKTGCIPDISKLSGVLISLGIGVVPYAFNKISTAITGKVATTN